MEEKGRDWKRREEKGGEEEGREGKRREEKGREGVKGGRQRVREAVQD